MTQRLQSRIACLLAAAATLLAHGVSQASPEFPGEIQGLLGMDCPPSCGICHIDPDGGGDLTIFGGRMKITGGLVAGDTSTVWPALATIEMARPIIDSDGDGLGDIVELRANLNPMINGNEKPDEIVCPKYGCGARVATQKPLDGSALLFAVAVAGYLGLRTRRRG